MLDLSSRNLGSCTFFYLPTWRCFGTTFLSAFPYLSLSFSLVLERSTGDRFSSNTITERIAVIYKIESVIDAEEEEG